MKLASLVLLISSAFGQSFEPSNHRFLDKTGIISLTGSAAVLTVDAVTTCRNLYGGGYEAFLPTQSCAGTSAWIASSFAAQTATAYLMHRTGHHRIERLAEFVWASGSAAGIAYTFTHQHHTLPVPPTTDIIPVHNGPTFCVVGTPGC
jgi:hypothetical protein